MNNVLILYFSRSGNTKRAASLIGEKSGADLCAVEPEEAYSGDYQTCVGRAVAEWKGNARPGVKAVPGDVSGYKKVVVGYPLWCGTMPMCLYTVLEKLDLSGKEIYALCTHEGSGFARSVEELAKLCPGAVVQPGLAVKGSQVASSEEILAAWAEENLK